MVFLLSKASFVLLGEGNLKKISFVRQEKLILVLRRLTLLCNEKEPPQQC